MDTTDVMTVVYLEEPDEVFELTHDGEGVLFGRDDAVCDVVIWSSLTDPTLSRVAGRIWRADGELWIRNLSTAHELTLVRPGAPAEPPLLPRTPDGIDPGPARAVGGRELEVYGPGGCALLLRQTPRAEFELPLVDVAEATMHVPAIPDHLRRTAVALCEPLLHGSLLPASYAEIGRRAGIPTMKRTRGQIAELCALYLEELPSLAERIEERQRIRDAVLRAGTSRRTGDGLWRFEEAAEAPVPRPRSRSLALPDYYEVAHLLVRRRLVRCDDLELLDVTQDLSA